MNWSRLDIAFSIIEEVSEHPVVTIVISTPDGRLMVMAEPDESGRTLRLRRVHVQAADAPRLELGIAKLRFLAETAMEAMGYDEIIVEGAVRTSGANPGRRPGRRRFARRVLPAGGEESG